jgi:hypothetical protein
LPRSLSVAAPASPPLPPPGRRCCAASVTYPPQPTPHRPSDAGSGVSGEMSGFFAFFFASKAPTKPAPPPAPPTEEDDDDEDDDDDDDDDDEDDDQGDDDARATASDRARVVPCGTVMRGTSAAGAADDETNVEAADDEEVDSDDKDRGGTAATEDEEAGTRAGSGAIAGEVWCPAAGLVRCCRCESMAGLPTADCCLFRCRERDRRCGSAAEPAALGRWLMSAPGSSGSGCAGADLGSGLRRNDPLEAPL